MRYVRHLSPGGLRTLFFAVTKGVGTMFSDHHPGSVRCFQTVTSVARVTCVAVRRVIPCEDATRSIRRALSLSTRRRRVTVNQVFYILEHAHPPILRRFHPPPQSPHYSPATVTNPPVRCSRSITTPPVRCSRSITTPPVRCSRSVTSGSPYVYTSLLATVPQHSTRADDDVFLAV
jgi:hypothetical protein